MRIILATLRSNPSSQPVKYSSEKSNLLSKQQSSQLDRLFNTGICLQYVQLIENLANQTKGVGPYLHFSKGHTATSGGSKWDLQIYVQQ